MLKKISDLGTLEKNLQLGYHNCFLRVETNIIGFSKNFPKRERNWQTSGKNERWMIFFPYFKYGRKIIISNHTRENDTRTDKLMFQSIRSSKWHHLGFVNIRKKNWPTLNISVAWQCKDENSGFKVLMTNKSLKNAWVHLLSNAIWMRRFLVHIPSITWNLPFN